MSFLISCKVENKHEEDVDIVDHRFSSLKPSYFPIKKDVALTYYPVICDTCLSNYYEIYHLYKNDSLVIDYKEPKDIDFNFDSIKIIFNNHVLYKSARINKIDSSIFLVDSLINKIKLNELNVIAYKLEDSLILDIRLFIYFKDSITRSNYKSLDDIW